MSERTSENGNGDSANRLAKRLWVLGGDYQEQDVRYLIADCDHPSNGHFVVFVDRKLDLDWECDDKCDLFIDSNSLRTARRKTLNSVALLEPTAHNWPEDLKLSAKRILGEAVVSILEGDTVGAETAVRDAQKFLKSKSRQVSRYWTLQACLVASGIAALIGAVEAIARIQIISYIGRTPFLLSFCFCAGCVGAMLFVVLGLGKQPNTDSTAERHLHYLEGVARIIGGGISGVLVGGMVKLGIILPVFVQPGMESLAMSAAAMMAGASERLAAGIVTSVENNHQVKQEDQNVVN